MKSIASAITSLREKYTPVSHVSTFRQNGQITPAEFLAAGDYLCYKFPTWNWANSDSGKGVTYFPADKQFLVTHNVPCFRPAGEHFAANVNEETLVGDGDDFKKYMVGADEEGWLQAGGSTGNSKHAKAAEVPATGGDNKSKVPDIDAGDEDDIPDMEDEQDDAAIVRDPESEEARRRRYTLYITYSPAYRTPRMYMCGYYANGSPIEPSLMMGDVVSDYHDQTATLEDFPFFANPTRVISIHPCRHAEVMKKLLIHADAAMRNRREKLSAGREKGVEGLADEVRKLDIGGTQTASSSSSVPAPAAADKTEEWEEVEENPEEQEIAIRVDQYLIVFLKFMASVTPAIEYDYTMSI